MMALRSIIESVLILALYYRQYNTHRTIYTDVTRLIVQIRVSFSLPVRFIWQDSLRSCEVCDNSYPYLLILTLEHSSL